MYDEYEKKMGLTKAESIKAEKLAADICELENRKAELMLSFHGSANKENALAIYKAKKKNGISGKNLKYKCAYERLVC